MTPHRTRKPLTTTISALLAASLVLTACGSDGAGWFDAATQPTQSPPPLPTSGQTYDPGTDLLVQVVERVRPSVVNVTTRVVNPNSAFGPDVGRSVGTGFIVRSDGIVVTNFHVVEGAVNIRVTLPPPDRRTFRARVIGGDSDHDLAVLKIEAEDLPTVPLGESSDLELGERVIALGYALALPGGPSVTSGIISALERTVQVSDPNGDEGQGIIRTLEDVLQTDAAINPGNSGGPLVDLAGNVVGINTAGAGSAENIGFAISVDGARPFIERAMEDPEAPVPYMGVSTTTVDAGVAAQFELPVDEGALVLQVAPGGPASRTSIREGDVIVAFDGTPVRTSDDLGSAILERDPGDEVTVSLVGSDGERFDVELTLGVRPVPTS